MKLKKVSHDIAKELKNPELAKVYNEELIKLELARTREKQRGLKRGRNIGQ